MGRARNNKQAIAVAKFNSVLGSTRGTPSFDLSGFETDVGAARELERLQAEVANGDFSSALAALSRHRRVLPHLALHPRLFALTDQIAAYICQRESGGRTHAARAALQITGADEDGLSQHILIWSRGQHQKLHVWEDGHIHPGSRGPQSYGIQQTLCGRDLTGVAWGRARRGQWAAAAADKDNADVTLCGPCKHAAPSTLPDFIEDANARFFSTELSAAAAVRELQCTHDAVLAAVLANESEAHTPRRLVIESEVAWRSHLISETAQIAKAEGAWTLNNLLPFEDALALCDDKAKNLAPEHYSRWAQSLTINEWGTALEKNLPVYVADSAFNRTRDSIGEHIYELLATKTTSARP